MSVTSSNMTSKHYCSKCGSFDLFKLHRTFIKKRILNAPNNLQCKSCDNVVKPRSFEKNIPREMSFCIESANSDPGTTYGLPDVSSNVPMCKKSLSIDEQCRSSTKEQHISISWDEFKAAESAICKVDENSISSLEGSPKLGVPEHGADEQEVDEVILIKDNQGAWPYMVASFLVLIGAVYAFVWMPMALNASETGVTRMDMSIGKPPQILDGPRSSTNIIPKLVVLDTPKISTERRVIKEKQTVKSLSEVAEPILITSSEVSMQRKDGSQVTPDISTKADRALGGLSDNAQVKKLTTADAILNGDVKNRTNTISTEKRQVVTVPSLTTSIRRYRVAEPEKKITQVTATLEKMRVLEQTDEAVTKVSTNNPFKAATSILQVNKKKSSGLNSKLVSEVPVNLIRQDLDKLFK